MADPITIIGLIGSVVGVANTGLKLAHTLYGFNHKVRIAEQSAQSVADEIEDTAITLKEFGKNLKAEKKSQGEYVDHRHSNLLTVRSVCSIEFYRTTHQNVSEIKTVFEETEDLLLEAGTIVRNEGGGIDHIEFRRSDRLRWPFRKSKLEMMQRDLERLKLSLSLKMQVMNHARATYDKKVIDE